LTRFEADEAEILGHYGSNHIHAVPGDQVETLRLVCRFLDVDFVGLGTAR
jgi:L-fucose isomerase